MVYNLSEELVKRGHEVTVFATGDSKVSGKLSYYYKKALSQEPKYKNDPLVWLHHFYDCFKGAGKFDIVHNHMQHPAIFLSDFIKTPVVHTLHGNFFPGETLESKREVLARFKKHNYVSISDAQRGGMPDLNYIKTVYNGINTAEFELGDGSGGYLAWIGRVTPKKGLETAIEISHELKIPLKISAYIDATDMEYFVKKIGSMINGKNVEFLGELHGVEKTEFLKNAKVLLFPITWQEPFGLVMVEAMACGTPVIAFNKGSVPEVVADGVNGFVVETKEEMKQAVSAVSGINRKKCQESVIHKFTIEKMTDGYEEVYRKICE